MKINRAYKTKLSLTRNQKRYLEQCGRVARTAFNWVLADYMTDYRIWHETFAQAKKAGLIPEGKIAKDAWAGIHQACMDAGIKLGHKPRPSGRVERKKRLNAIKKTDPHLAFLCDFPYVILQEAIDDFDKSMDAYARHYKNGDVFRKIEEGKTSIRYQRRIARMIERGRVGEQLDPFFPRFKRRDEDPSFRFPLDSSFQVEDNRVKLPKIGWLRLAERGYIPSDPVKFCSATISRDRGDWFISVAVEQETETPTLKPVTLGVSVGASDLAATSSGSIFDNPRAMVQFEKKKKHLQRELSRRSHFDEEGKVIRGKNWLKTKEKVSRLEAKIARVRRHHQHNASKAITDTLPERIVLKDVRVKDVLHESIRQIAKRLADAGIGETLRQITYKAQWKGTSVDKATGVNHCSVCGSEAILVNYSTKQMKCSTCGHSMRASVNVAINLSKEDVHA